MSEILLILLGAVGVLFILWLIFKNAVEIYNFGEFVCFVAMFIGISAAIGFVIGLFAKNQLKGIIIGAIVGFVLFIGFCLLCSYYVYCDKRALQQYYQTINDTREQSKQILAQNWKCPSCGKVNSSNINSCSNVFMRFYENGQLIERYFDKFKAYDLFFDRENYKKYVYLKECIGWRCDVCGSVNTGGFKCKNCGIDTRGDYHYTEYIKKVNENSHCCNEYYPDGTVKTKVVYDN